MAAHQSPPRFPTAGSAGPARDRFGLTPPNATRSLSRREKRLLPWLALHLSFPAWALGGMTIEGQWLALATGVVTAAIALWPSRLADHAGAPGDAARVALRSVPVWAGWLVLVYVTIQALNPAWRYVVEGDEWSLEPVPHLGWLPAGMDTPFAISSPWRVLIILASAWLALVAIVAGIRRRRAVRIVLTIVAVNTAGGALLGLAQQLTHARGLFWSYTPASSAAWFGSFIYRNHAAALLGLGLAVALALTVFHHRRSRQRLERSGPAPMFALLAAGLALGAVFTFSRLGALLTTALLAGVGFWTLTRLARRRRSRATWFAMAIVTLTVGSVAVFGVTALDWQRLRERYAELPTSTAAIAGESRVIVYRAGVEMLQANWLSGWGAGGFRFFFPVFQQNHPTIYDTQRIALPDGTIEERPRAKRLFWEHAHNDLLQIPIEFGLVGTLLLAAGPLWWLGATLRARVWRFAPGAIVLAGLGVTFVHAGGDFVFQNPAVWMTWNALWPLLAHWTSAASARRGPTDDDAIVSPE